MIRDTQSFKFPIEVRGIPGLVLTVSIGARSEMLDALAAVGVGPEELPNFIRARLEDVTLACDGSVQGLVVGSLED